MRLVLALLLLAACSASRPSAAQDAPAGILEALRLGMRLGLGSGPRPSTPREVQRAIAPARCEVGGWVQDEEGVLEARARHFTAAHGPPAVSGLERRWQTSDRSVLLIEPGPVCGGFCIGHLEIAGRGHPDLTRRGSTR